MGMAREAGCKIAKELTVWSQSDPRLLAAGKTGGHRDTHRQSQPVGNFDTVFRFQSAKGYRVILKYKSSADPRHEEHSIIDDLRRSHRLLNDCRAFDYTSANELEEIHRSLLEVLKPPSS